MATQCTTHKMTTFQRHAGRLFAGLLLCCASAGLGAQELAVTDPAAAPLGDLVRKFTDAQVQRDAAALRALTSEQYIEVSPVGELDAREKMLGFYVKDASRAAPALAIDEWVFRPTGDSAVVIAKLNFTMTAEQKKLFKELSKTLGKEVVPQREKTFLDKLKDVFSL